MHRPKSAGVRADRSRIDASHTSMDYTTGFDARPECRIPHRRGSECPFGECGSVTNGLCQCVPRKHPIRRGRYPKGMTALLHFMAWRAPGMARNVPPVDEQNC
jgi:hypothetical protein